jgi:hypothetical protein
MSTLQVDTIVPALLAAVSIPSLDKRMAVAYCRFTSAGVIESSFNVASVTVTSTGAYTITSSNGWSATDCPMFGSTVGECSVLTLTATTATCVTRNSSGVATAASLNTFYLFGE